MTTLRNNAIADGGNELLPTWLPITGPLTLTTADDNALRYLPPGKALLSLAYPPETITPRYATTVANSYNAHQADATQPTVFNSAKGSATGGAPLLIATPARTAGDRLIAAVITKTTLGSGSIAIDEVTNNGAPATIAQLGLVEQHPYRLTVLEIQDPVQGDAITVTFDYVDPSDVDYAAIHLLTIRGTDNLNNESSRSETATAGPIYLGGTYNEGPKNLYLAFTLDGQTAPGFTLPADAVVDQTNTVTGSTHVFSSFHIESGDNGTSNVGRTLQGPATGLAVDLVVTSVIDPSTDPDDNAYTAALYKGNTTAGVLALQRVATIANVTYTDAAITLNVTANEAATFNPGDILAVAILNPAGNANGLTYSPTTIRTNTTPGSEELTAYLDGAARHATTTATNLTTLPATLSSAELNIGDPTAGHLQWIIGANGLNRITDAAAAVLGNAG